jgi:hypothetical protein
MADDKRGREKQADDADRRQRKRDVRAELRRGDEPEPPVELADLDEVERELGAVSFPATGSDVVSAVGDREVDADDGPYAVADLLPNSELDRFAEPADVRDRIQRPTVAGTMKRIVERADEAGANDLEGSQWSAYERTFLELEAIDAVDEDEGIRVVGDWVVARIDETGTLPGSRAVRRRAAKYCRANGYDVRNDEWLGV